MSCPCPPKMSLVFPMSDGTPVVTELVPCEDSLPYIYLLLEYAVENGDMVIGLDTEWCMKEIKLGVFRTEYRPRVGLLKLCSGFGCVLIRLENSASDSLKRFFAVKDIMFAGIRMKEDLQNLREEYGIIIRNAVDLSELSAKVLGQPQLSAYGVRELASKVLSIDIPPSRSLLSIWAIRSDSFPSLEQVESAATDAYATYKVGRRLLGTES
ncbi:uncharacterized protein At5g06450-like [Herrania umbratica]|uniref:Uncharacterized protein At5g06450-like n=1 Tax=Herrania umbratica TaxID=108875 RepID=A0A6J1A8C7_9ROSI|nr:uncharacterized protein At5g06450-like [Herrania umbratica]